MSDFKLLCRLCMSTGTLQDIFNFCHNNELSLEVKIASCINIKVHQGDGLPSFICNECKKEIDRFYDFKQKCSEIDWKLRNIFIQPNFKCHLFSDISLDTKIKSNDMNKDDNSHEPYFIENIESKSAAEDQQIFESDKSLPCNEKNSETIQRKEYHKSGTSKTTFQCELCGHTFKRKSSLEKHVMTHSGIKPFACNMCSKRFTRAENQLIHMRSHAGIKPYICEVCGSTSTKRQDLIRHMKIHSDERRHICMQCNRSFKRSGDLSSHIRTHMGVRPYKCNMCEKNYSSHSGLRKHYKSHSKKELLDSKINR